MGHVLTLLQKIVGSKLIVILLAVAAVAVVFPLSNVFKAHALNVHTEIRADSPGIVRIIDRTGEPPPGIVNSEGNGPTAPTTNPNASSGQPGGPGSTPPPGDDDPPPPDGTESTPPPLSDPPPPGIEKIIAGTGAPPAGLVNPKGNRPTTLTINTDIEFGNVFPGEVQQGEFTIFITDDDFQGNPTTVSYQLILSTPGGSLNLSPYLAIVRDTNETDAVPDTPASASLTSPNDTFDRWLVTLTVPNDPPKGDYWTIITVLVPPPSPG
jgi:hypothetical protein